MPITSGVFGKAELTPGALTKIFYNSSANAATINILFCNLGSTQTKVRIAIIPAATTNVALKDYIIFDQTLPVGSTFECTGVAISSQETVYCYTKDGTVSTRVHGYVNDRGPAVSDIGMATYNNAGLTLYASGLDTTSTDKAATPALVKAILDAYGGGGGGGGGFGVKMTTILQSKLNANTQITVPSYLVGQNKLNVFINGILCMGGTDNEVYAYNEVGMASTTSTTITVFDSYDKGTEIVAMA